MIKSVLGIASAAALALTLPAIAQQKAPAPSGKVEVPAGVFYAGLGPTQYLVKSRLIGAEVVDKAGTKLAIVEDVILGTKDDKIDGFIIEVAGKKLGVRMAAAKVESKDGKSRVVLEKVTAEMLKVLPAFGAKK